MHLYNNDAWLYVYRSALKARTKSTKKNRSEFYDRKVTYKNLLKKSFRNLC